MQTSQIDRRAAASKDLADSVGPYADAAHVVRQGMGIQASMGTRSAVEFLKHHGVHGAVIHRVLMGEQVRSDDQEAGQVVAGDRMPGADGVAIDDPRM